MTKIDLTDMIKPKSDQLNADDLIAGSITVKITKVVKRSGEQPIAYHYEGDDGKPYYPCKSMMRVIVAIWGKYADEHIGKQMTLYRDPTVTWAGAEVGGIRISHMSDIEKPVTMSLTASRKSRKPYTVLPLKEVAIKKVEPEKKSASARIAADKIITQMNAAKSEAEVKAVFAANKAALARLSEAYPDIHDEIIAASELLVFNDDEELPI